MGQARRWPTYVFDEQVAWLATQCSKTAVTELMRIAWCTVGAIITRVWADVEALHDRFAGLSRRPWSTSAATARSSEAAN